MKEAQFLKQLQPKLDEETVTTPILGHLRQVFSIPCLLGIGLSKSCQERM